MLFRFLLLAFCAVSVWSDESVEHGSHQESKHTVGGKHNPEYDHEAVIGSKKEHKEFDELSPEESKRRLGILVDTMDTDKDGYITKDDLTEWIYNSFKKLDAEEAEDYFKDQDKNEDNLITLKEYIQNYYGYDPEQMENWDEDKNEEMREMAKLLKEDEAKFKLADADADGALNLEEYNAFYHPWDHEHMHEFEIEKTLIDQDANGDGFIDIHEYMGDEEDDPESQILERENFAGFDKNGDDKLDREEIKAWVIPDNMETAEEECEHLMQETDTNHDGKLSREEILNASEAWVGSSATDYGAQIKERFHDPSEL